MTNHLKGESVRGDKLSISLFMRGLLLLSVIVKLGEVNVHALDRDNVLYVPNRF